MKEEKIYLGKSDYSISLIVWSQVVGKINNRILPTLTALGLCNSVGEIIDAAVKGSEYIKEIFEKRFLESHPAMLTNGLESYAKYEVERTVSAACKEFRFAPLTSAELNAHEAQFLKEIATIKDGRLSIDISLLEKKHEIYAIGENAKLYREIENALKILNKAFRKHLDKSTFNALFYWGEDKQLHFKDTISLKVLDEIRGIKE